jgi:hypothetical protein
MSDKREPPDPAIWVIWSEEHGAWWAPNAMGYCRSILQAGRYGFKEAARIVRRAHIARDTLHEIHMLDPLLCNRFRVTGREEDEDGGNER